MALPSEVFNPPLQFGDQFVHSLSQLKKEFGYDGVAVPANLIPIVTKYFTAGKFYSTEALVNHIEEKDKGPIQELLDNRIDKLENSNTLKNNSIVITKKIKGLINEFETLKKKIAKAEAEPVEEDSVGDKEAELDLAKAFWKSLWLLVNVSLDTKEAEDEWNALNKKIDEMAPDELITTVTNLKETIKSGDLKAKQNALQKFIGPTSSAAKSVPTTETSIDLLNIDPKTKTNLLKLFSAFQANKTISRSSISSLLTGKDSKGLPLTDAIQKRINKTAAEDIVNFMSSQNPSIARNIRLAFRSVTAFYKDRYKQTLDTFSQFLKDKYKLDATDIGTGYSTSKNQYPIDAMIRIGYELNDLEKLVIKPTTATIAKKGGDPRYKIFANNQGLIKLTSDTKYDMIRALIDNYSTYMSTNHSSLTNDIKPVVNSNNLNYQLIEMHTITGRSNSGILQLVDGKDIRIDTDKLKNKINDLTKSKIFDPRTINQAKIKMVEATILDFFKDKDTSIFIVYQESPRKLLKEDNIKIKQLDTLECLLATVDSVKLGPGGRSDMKEVDTNGILNQLSFTQNGKGNTFSDFGITIQPNPLVFSLTQKTITLLNAAFVEYKMYFASEE